MRNNCFLIMLKKNNKKETKRHTCHLSKHPHYPYRSHVEYVSWLIEDSKYAPINFTHPLVFQFDRIVKSVDPEWSSEMEFEVSKRFAFSIIKGEDVKINTVTMYNGKPRNPIGRTGMIGRGLLGKWGPNYTIDSIVTRFNPKTNILQVVAICRPDTGEWFIPSDPLEAGNNIYKTLKTALLKDIANLPFDHKGKIDKINDLLSNGGNVCYSGYVDDLRNTDNSWLETTAIHFHIQDEELASDINLNCGDDKKNARWLNIDYSDKHFNLINVNHRFLIIKALEKNKDMYREALRKIGRY
jgi:ADP-ribose pyrophosphatase